MEWIAALKKLLGEDIISSDSDVLKNYASDYTEDFVFLPHAVATPRTTAQVSTILSFCNEHNIPVTPRGAGTGLSGGSLPVMGGVSLSMGTFQQDTGDRRAKFSSNGGMWRGKMRHFNKLLKKKACSILPILPVKEVAFWVAILRTAAAVPKH